MNTSTTLHIVSQSDTESDALSRCLAAVSAGDAVLLTENGVYACRQLAEAKIKGYALEPDIKARNVEAGKLDIIDYDGFVELCARHAKTVSWF